MSPATTLEGLASAVGLTAEELFHGTDFSGVDLTDEKIELLSRIDANYTGAILTRQQRRIIDAAPARRLQTRQKIAKLRCSIMRQFIDKTIKHEHRTTAETAFVNPLQNESQTKIKRNQTEIHYAPLGVRFLTAEPSRLLLSVSDALDSFLGALKRAKMPIDHRLLDAWPKAASLSLIWLQPDRVEELIDFDLCTASFVVKWLDEFEVIGGDATRPRLNDIDHADNFQERRPSTVARAVSAGDEARGDALRVAIRGPSRPAAPYLQAVLGRARSGEELRDLTAAIPPGAMDQAAAATVARMLARGATNAKSIAATLSDERQHTRVANAFRRLLVAAGTPQGRRALLETIAELGERASGLEVDAVVVGLSFNDTIQMIRPYWSRLTPHHQNISRNALLEKAASATERSQIDKLSMGHLIRLPPSN